MFKINKINVAGNIFPLSVVYCLFKGFGALYFKMYSKNIFLIRKVHKYDTIHIHIYMNTYK